MSLLSMSESGNTLTSVSGSNGKIAEAIGRGRCRMGYLRQSESELGRRCDFGCLVVWETLGWLVAISLVEAIAEPVNSWRLSDPLDLRAIGSSNFLQSAAYAAMQNHMA